MGSCDLNTECHFLNEIMRERPLTTGYAQAVYCNGDFARCTIYRVAQTHGIDRVPIYVNPDDQYELSRRVIELALQDKSSW